MSGYSESFNGKLKDEPLNGEIFYSLRKAWRWTYKTIRPHCALGYRTPASEAVLHQLPCPGLP